MSSDLLSDWINVFIDTFMKYNIAPAANMIDWIEITFKTIITICPKRPQAKAKLKYLKRSVLTLKFFLLTSPKISIAIAPAPNPIGRPKIERSTRRSPERPIIRVEIMSRPNIIGLNKSSFVGILIRIALKIWIATASKTNMVEPLMFVARFDAVNPRTRTLKIDNPFKKVYAESFVLSVLKEDTPHTISTATITLKKAIKLNIYN